MNYIRKYNVTLDGTTAGSFKIRIPLRKAGLATFATGSDWTPGAGDVKVSKDGGSEANIGTLPAYSNGAWEFVLSNTELTAKLVTVRVSDAAVDDEQFNIETYGNASAMWAAVLGLTAADTITTYTGNTVQTGDAYGRIGAAGAGLTAVGDARLANLDATVGSRMATYTQPTGFLAATFPGTVASTTNITAGVITTVTNLTNAPTAGDFTATMKASITTAATASTPSVTVSDKTGFSLVAGYDPAKTAAQAGDAMALTGGERTTLAASIWNALVSGITTANTIGKRLVDYVTGDTFARLGAPAGASMAADIAAVKVDTAAVKVVTDKLNSTLEAGVGGGVFRFTVASLINAPSGSGGGGGITLATVVDGLTVESIFELMIALSAGRSSLVDHGDGTKTVTFKKQDGTTTKYTVTFSTLTQARSASVVS